MTQTGQEQRRPGQAALAAVPPRARIEPGTLMEKLVPVNLVEPYLSGQRWVITGFAYPAADPPRAAGEAERWILRWRALDMQTYSEAFPAGGLFIEPCPIPVGAGMYRVTAEGEEFVARHDGQSWLRPAAWAGP